MADLPSILGGMAQGFIDFGKSAVDLFGTGGATIGDLIESARTGKVTTKNQDDFRKWLYNTDSVEDAAAKGLGTALNGVQTAADFIPGIGAVTKNPLFNAGQGALGGLADEFKMYGKDYDLGRSGERAAVGAGGALAASGLGDALKQSANPLLSSGTVQGLARGATGGAIGAGGYTAIEGGDLNDIMNSAAQGAGMGAAIGGATGALRDFRPAKTYDIALTDNERQARIANAKNMLANEQNPERIAELNNQINRLLDEADLIEELRANSANISDDGMIDLYHRTTPENADNIYTSGRMFSKEAESPLYFSTNRDAQPGYGSAVVHAKMPVGLLQIDDEFGDNADLRYVAGVKPGEPVDMSKWLVRQEPSLEATLSADDMAVNNQIKRLGGTLADVDNRQAQFDLLQKTNPMRDDYHTGIRSPEDIYTLKSIVDSYNADNNFTYPDFTLADAQKALASGNIDVYSSKPIEAGAFISPSKMMATDYAGSGEVYTKNIPLRDFAFIESGDEGNYLPTPKALETTLADADMVVNNVPEATQGAAPQYKRIYHGTNATFTDFDEKLPSVWFTDNADDIANTGLSNRGGKLNIMERDLPSDLKLADWDLADNYTKQQLIDRGYDGIAYDGSGASGNDTYYEIFNPNKTLKKVDKNTRYSKADPSQSLEKTLANGDAEINRVGSAEVAPVDPSTLPESIRAAKGFLDKDYIKDIENYSGKKIENMTDSELIDYALSKKPEKDREVLREAYGDIIKGGTTARDVAESVAKNAYLYKIGESDFSDGDAGGVMDYLLHHGAQLREGRTKAADIELSDRLGIAPSNTFMRDNANPYDSYGSYDPSSTTISIGNNTVGENAIGTVGHERLHSFQVESLLDRYDKEVLDAYKDLSKDLDKYIKTDAEIAKLHADDPTDLAYWGNKDEQQARMLQQYLENKNYTKTGSIRNRAKEWGNEINPSFDKFFDKLRDLSKRGVALPALTALFGGGAYMANQNNDKEKEVK